MIEKIILIVYGLFLMIGGYFGFKKGSMVSLAMGLGSGLMVFLGVWLMTINPKGAWIFLSCISGFLALTFTIRLLKTHAFMPSGMLLILSAVMALFCIWHILKIQ